jgi:DNA-binding response OmpR family regulator
VNVLIVDDNEIAADLLRELLQLQEHSVHCAYSGQTGLDAAAADIFDAVLVDLMLPDLPGVEVARRLREAAAGEPLLLVAVSGLSARDAPDALTPGLFDHYLEKPIDFALLDRIFA